jgi:tetratricopeptide (TPR) repeat protein
LLHLVSSRLARKEGNSEAAQRATSAGIHAARQSGLGLYHIELLCEQAEVCLARGDAPAAAGFAQSALERALAADCQFRWGAGEAAHLVGAVLLAQQAYADARAALERARDIREQIGDPRLIETTWLLKRFTE